MGFWQNLLSLLKWKKKRANVLVVGLDNSGKSTVVNYFKSGQGAKQSQRSSVPTIGFQVDEIQNGPLKITAFDMSGQSRYRSLWERYYVDCQGVVFVVDSSDAMRMAVASNELQLMMEHPEMVGKPVRVPVLILANKCDLENAIPADQINAELGLDGIKNYPIHLEVTNALTGIGLDQGLKWLSDEMIRII